MSSRVRVLTLCTGNVARSAMLAEMLAVLAEGAGLDWELRSAGTLAVEGLSVSGRTLAALGGIPELAGHGLGRHRSRQLSDEDLAWADVVLAVEATQVAYVDARHPEDAGKVAHLGTLCAGSEAGGLVELARVAASRPAREELDVADPAGGDQSDYDACCAQLWVLAQGLVARVDA